MHSILLLSIYLLISFNSFSQTINEITLPDSVSIQSNSPVRKSPDHSGELILRTKGISKALLLDRFGEYLEVKLDTIMAYVSYAFLVQD